MNYLAQYMKLIRIGLARTEKPKGFHAHHIFPRCIFGDNNYTAILSQREHKVAHRLLAKAYPMIGPLCNAANLMQDKHPREGTTLTDEHKAKIAKARTGYKHSEETKQKLRQIQLDKMERGEWVRPGFICQKKPWGTYPE